jgi:hypothetical protein
MNSTQLASLLELGDLLWASKLEQEKRTALMIFQCGCNMQSSDAYLRMYKAKKESSFKSKKYPSTAIQDLFTAITLQNLEALLIAVNGNFIAEPMFKLFYLEVAKRQEKKINSSELKNINELVEITKLSVPLFMQSAISTHIDSLDGVDISLPPEPLCKSCKYQKRWEGLSPFCTVLALPIEKFISECQYYLKIDQWPADLDQSIHKVSFDESYNDT